MPISPAAFTALRRRSMLECTCARSRCTWAKGPRSDRPARPPASAAAQQTAVENRRARYSGSAAFVGASAKTALATKPASLRLVTAAAEGRPDHRLPCRLPLQPPSFMPEAYHKDLPRMASKTYESLSSTRWTCTADHAPAPRAVGMPCAFRPSAMARRVVAPAACSALIVGARSAARCAARC
jgi:hypothetical protein